MLKTWIKNLSALLIYFWKIYLNIIVIIVKVIDDLTVRTYLIPTQPILIYCFWALNVSLETSSTSLTLSAVGGGRLTPPLMENCNYDP